MLWRMSADPNEQGIGDMGFLFRVILSAAKDLIAACHGHEILRCAQDDSGAAPQPAIKVSATKVSPRRSAIAKWAAETAETGSRSFRNSIIRYSPISARARWTSTASGPSPSWQAARSPALAARSRMVA